MSSNKEEERRLATLYGTIQSSGQKKFILPKTVSKRDLKNYIQEMIRINQPRHIRVDGRKSHSIDDYKIPVNYFVVDSNTVSYNASQGTIYVDNDVDADTEEGNTNLVTSVPNRFRSDDIGQQIILHIFKHGRKTIDELITELQGLDKHMLTILVNKLIEDGYLQTWEDKEGKKKKKLQTLELVEKPKELDSKNE